MFGWEEPDEDGMVMCSFCAGTGYDPKHAPESCARCYGSTKECAECGEGSGDCYCTDDNEE